MLLRFRNGGIGSLAGAGELPGAREEQGRPVAGNHVPMIVQTCRVACGDRFVLAKRDRGVAVQQRR